MISGRMCLRLAATVAALLMSTVACSQQLYTVTIDGHEFTVEIADTPETRQRGLMERESLGERSGMLFVFPESDLRSFWMRNTLIPLSIAYIDEGFVIREIYDMEPLSRVPVPSRVPAMFALEVNVGVFDELGIRPGDRVRISDRLRSRLRDSPAQ